MFCPNCGTQVQNNAKFCYMCGAKIRNDFSDNDEIEISKIRNDDLVEEYTEQIQDKILQSYLKGEEILASSFYDKASLYDMTQNDVDNAYNKEINVIKHLNEYINKIFENGKRFISPETFNPNDFEQYASRLGVETDISREFWNNYIEKNEINEKQDFFSDVIEEYGTTGKVFEEVPEDYKDIKTISPDVLLEQYKELVFKVELLIENEYTKSDNDKLTEEQYKTISDEIVKKGLLEKHIKYFISGYEKKSGIENKKKNERKARVLEKVKKGLDRDYTILGTNVTFGAKYFLKIYIKLLLDDTLKRFKIEYENMSKTSNNAVYNLIDIFGKYDSNYFDTISKIENLLEINVEYRSCCRSMFDSIWEMIEKMAEDFGEIDARVAVGKIRRQIAVENRGRWQGGGFGISGAIKGAATASAMNAVSGIAHSGVALIGNAISGLGAIYDRQKGIKSIKAVFPKLENMNAQLTESVMTSIHENYPELYFDPYADDTFEEQELRRKLVHVMCTKEKKRIIINELLEINPANWRNGIEILGQSMKYPEFLDKGTVNAYENLEKFFGWTENLDKEIQLVKNELLKNKEKISAWDFMDEEFYDRANKLYELSQRFLRSAGEENKLSEDLRYIETNIGLIKQIMQFNLLLSKVKNMSKEQVLDIGNQYCVENEWVPAKKIFFASVNNDEIFQKVLEAFYEGDKKNKSQIITLMHAFIKRKETIDATQYDTALYILAKFKDKSGKTMLIYAAEEHDELIIKELIKHGADIELLKRTIDINYASNVSKDYKNCPFCGKAILKTSKFCNYCGQKI